MRTFGFGFIGLGGMSKWHLMNLHRFPEFRLAAICDVNAESVEKVGEEEGVPPECRYTDYTKLIADPAVEVVICVTPNNTHADIIRACIEAGKPFMAEKPFTRTFAEAEELVKVYHRNRLPNMIGFSYRYHPQFRYVKELIDSGKVGKVRSIFIQYLQGWGSASVGNSMAWRFDKSITGTGALGDLGSHMIDTARFLVGEFLEVSGRLATFIRERTDLATGHSVSVEVDDFVSFNAQLEGEVEAVFQTSRNAIGSGNQHEAFIYGDKGSLKVTSEDRNNIIWMHLDEQGNHAVEKIPVSQQKGVDQWDEFMKLLHGEDSPMVTTVVDGYINQAVMEAIIISNQEKRTVAVPTVLN